VDNQIEYENEDCVLRNISDNHSIECIILDTNVFYAANFNYASKFFTSFLKNTKEKDIQIYITDIINFEIRQGIHNTIDNMDDKTIKALANSGLLNIETNINKAKNSLIKILTDNFDNLIKDHDIEIIECDGNIKSLLDLYFNQKPPFSNKKQNEFKDSISLLTIKNKIDKKELKNAIFVSNDNLCCEFCKTNGIPYKNLIGDASNAILQQDKKFRTIYNKIKRSIEDHLKNTLERDKELKFEVSGFLYSGIFDIEIYDTDIEILEAKITKISIIDMDNITDNNNSLIEYAISISIDLDLKIQVDTPIYEDGSTAAAYDKEDDKFYWIEYKKTKFSILREFKNVLFTIHYYIEDKSIELEQETCIDIAIEGDIDDIFSDRNCEIIKDEYIDD